jgi:molybdate transport system ATP-binding protein
MLEVSLNDVGQPALNAKFTCSSGQLLALVGPSGAGKSTVLRCIAGLHKASQGLIRSKNIDWFNSDDKKDLTPQQRRVGFVFQNYALFPHLTVSENIQLANTDNSEQNSTENLLSKVRLHGLGDRYPHQLSGGQQQRVAIARALARNPDVLLLDEPFSAVDKVTRRKLYMELNSLRSELEMPIILVTHDLDEAAMLADSMVVIHHGQTLQQGCPSQVLHHPDTVAVAKLVDVRNLFKGEVVKDNNGTKLHWNNRQLTLSDQQDYPQHAVDWTISPSKVILHQRVRPSRGEQENPVTGRIIELLTLRGISTVLVAINDASEVIIQMDISEHVAARNNLKVGDEITVSLIAESIHLMSN